MPLRNCSRSLVGRITGLRPRAHVREDHSPYAGLRCDAVSISTVSGFHDCAGNTVCAHNTLFLSWFLDFLEVAPPRVACVSFPLHFLSRCLSRTRTVVRVRDKDRNGKRKRTAGDPAWLTYVVDRSYVHNRREVSWPSKRVAVWFAIVTRHTTRQVFLRVIRRKCGPGRTTLKDSKPGSYQDLLIFLVNFLSRVSSFYRTMFFFYSRFDKPFITSKCLSLRACSIERQVRRPRVYRTIEIAVP